MTLFKEQQKTLVSYLWDETKANKFLGAVAYCFQANPKLAECTPSSIVSAFMKCAELDIFPSSVDGQAYILPYANSQKGISEAQFQIGYQGLVTLFYRAGAISIRSEIVRQHDVDTGRFSEVNGVITHRPDTFNPDRDKSPAVGAYVIVDLPTGGSVSKSMSKTKIFEIRDKFSKSKDTASSPWQESRDPELWMWKKTVLKQLSKLVPKNELIIRAVVADNEGDTDFEEIDRNDLRAKALRPSDRTLADTLAELPGWQTAPKVVDAVSKAEVHPAQVEKQDIDTTIVGELKTNQTPAW